MKFLPDVERVEEIWEDEGVKKAITVNFSNGQRWVEYLEYSTGVYGEVFQSYKITKMDILTYDQYLKILPNYYSKEMISTTNGLMYQRRDDGTVDVWAMEPATPARTFYNGTRLYLQTVLNHPSIRNQHVISK